MEAVATRWVRDDDAVAHMANILVLMSHRFQERIDAAAGDVQEQSWWFQPMNG